MTLTGGSVARMLTSPIRVCGEIWHVPRGFGADYRRRLDSPATPETIRSMLEFIGYTAKPEHIAAWPLRRRVEAEAYAANVHLRAADNPIKQHTRPDWMPEPWEGPKRGEGIWQGPGPTVLT